MVFFFFFQAEDGIRDYKVTGVQTCALPILLHDTELLDLNYLEDKDAEVDMNLVMTGGGQFVEVQGSGEESTFSRGQLDRLLKLGKIGIDAVTRRQRQALGSHWPLD